MISQDLFNLRALNYTVPLKWLPYFMSLCMYMVASNSQKSVISANVEETFRMDLVAHSLMSHLTLLHIFLFI